MIRMLAPLLALLALAACGTEQSPAARLLGQALDDADGAGAAASAGAPRDLTRAQVDALGVALIRIRLLGEEARPVMSGAAVNGGFVEYVSRFQQMVVLKGSLVTATRGLGWDLISLAPGADDPVADPRPPAAWPAGVRRTYRFAGPGPGGRTVTVDCRYVPGDVRTIGIVEVTHRVRRIEEVCAGDGVAFSNVHLADTATGRVWSSVQWTGPDQGRMALTVVEPFGEDD